MAVEIDGTSKGLLGAVTVFALGSGIASIIYGVLLLLRYMGIEFNYGGFNLYPTSILLIVVGGLLVITVILGAVGALKDKSQIRLTTLVLLFILFAILAAVGVWGMVTYKTGRLQRSIDADIDAVTKFKEGDTGYPAIEKSQKYLTSAYNCCGVYSTYDTRATDENIPDSCCIVPGCSQTTLNNQAQNFKEGCASVYSKTKTIAVFHLAILSLVAAGLTLLALIFYAVVSQRARAGYAEVSRG